MQKGIQSILAFLIVLSVTVIPAFKFSPSLPSVQLIDVLLPCLVVYIFVERKNIVFQKLYLYLVLFCGYIIFTLFWNNLHTSLIDYFEVYKLLKFMIVIVFFSLITIDLKRTVTPIFGLLIVFNLLHYFNVFNFNSVVKAYYEGGIHIDLFGLNSIGEPAVKRMIGTMGNPNNNALLFTFFSILFLPINSKKTTDFVLFTIATTMVLLCQSRTSMAAFAIMIATYFVLNKQTTKQMFSVIGLLLGAYALFLVISISSDLRPVFEGGLKDYSSLRGRFEVWEFLWEMIKQKPIFGHSPNKNYFYENTLYAENEYILYTWRYGIIGLIAYVSFLGYIFKKGIQYKAKLIGLQLALIIIVIALTALTNVPLSDRSIIVFFAVVLGVFFKKNNTT